MFSDSGLDWTCFWSRSCQVVPATVNMTCPAILRGLGDLMDDLASNERKHIQVHFLQVLYSTVLPLQN